MDQSKGLGTGTNRSDPNRCAGESDAALQKSPAMDQSVSCNEFG